MASIMELPIGLDIPREELPQISPEHNLEFIRFCLTNNIGANLERREPKNLKPSQSNLNKEKINSIRDTTAAQLPIIVSSDGYILDGHHRWGAQLVDGKPVICITVNLPIRELIELAKKFAQAEYKAITEWHYLRKIVISEIGRWLAKIT